MRRGDYERRRGIEQRGRKRGDCERMRRRGDYERRIRSGEERRRRRGDCERRIRREEMRRMGDCEEGKWCRQRSKGRRGWRMKVKRRSNVKGGEDGRGE
jgi:hypothetical protein